MIFPSEFKTVDGSTCEIKIGLKGSGLTCSVLPDKHTVVISGFDEFKKSYITFEIWATNPSTAGPTSYWKIYTYWDSGTRLIDRNL